ncbi:MAG TPA: 5-(carboxyamino)imidazole ribonucleotide mutase [Bacteroidales bacterium]|nr:5-(carboxyamino)imidazole ribonucleotide mutase [Bacteroidales bacterium]
MTSPLVGIIMGSDSDLPVMSKAAEILEKFNIDFEITIVSAHRTPDRMVQYARSAVSRGLKVIIAGAGGAAHLPGMIAAITALPVIGVPVKSANLSGLDSLLSIVQMPEGVPVATVAINSSANAALLAAQIIGSHDKTTLEKVEKYKQSLRETVEEKASRLENFGFRKYLEGL